MFNFNRIASSIKKNSSVYNAFHLLSEIDEAGYVTDYQYDNAGRLIVTTKGDSRTEYVYRYQRCQWANSSTS